MSRALWLEGKGIIPIKRAEEVHELALLASRYELFECHSDSSPIRRRSADFDGTF